MKQLFLSLLLIPALAGGQSYHLEVKTQVYSEISNPTYEIPDTSIYFDQVYTSPVMMFKAFGNTYNLQDKVFIPLKEGYSYIINSTRSTTIYAAKGSFGGRPGTNQVSVFSFATEGGSPNKVFVMQWKNMGFTSGDSSHFINFQTKLYETSGVIEFHFGPSSVKSGLWPGGASGPTIGLLHMDDQFSTIYDQLWLQGSASAPSMVSTSGAINLSGTPSSGTLYRFVPGGPGSVRDKAVSMTRVYPTLVTSREGIHIDRKDDEPYQATVSDVSGRIIHQQELQDDFLLCIPGLQSGIYQLQIRTKHSREVFRILVR